MPSRIIQKRQHRSPKKNTGRSLKKLVFWVFLFLLVGSAVFFWYLFRPGNSLTSTKKILFVPSNLNDKSSNIVLVDISPQTSRIEVGVFSAELPVEVLGGYGSYPLRSLGPLLTLDKKSPTFIRAAYSTALMLPVDEVVVVDNEALLSDSPNVDTLWWQLLTYKLHSQASFLNRWSVYRSSKKMDSTQRQVQIFQNQDEWQKGRSEFGFKELSPDCAVAVLNTTSTPGTGSVVTQILENGGIPVIRLSDTPDRLETTRVLLTHPAPFCQEVIDTLPAIFPSSVETKIESGTMSKHRANIVILIGEDFAKEVAKKHGK